MSAPRIAAIHALHASIGPTLEAFARAWPRSRVMNLLDDALSLDLVATGRLDEAMVERFVDLGRYARRAGADAILFTCSAFGEAIDRVRHDLDVPVLKPNEAMVEQAVREGAPVALLATFAPTLASMAPEFEREAERQRRAIDVVPVHVAGALEALQRGDPERHDAIVLEEVNRVAGPRTIALAQFSMARAADAISAATGRRVLTTPDAAVQKLRLSLGG
jgi:hypothetical protein